jgi:hypothetical protein
VFHRRFQQVVVGTNTHNSRTHTTSYNCVSIRYLFISCICIYI